MLTPEERAAEFERAKRREYQRQYQAKNREKLNAYQRERYRNNTSGYRDYIIERNRAKYWVNIEESRRLMRERYAQKKEAMKNENQ